MVVHHYYDIGEWMLSKDYKGHSWRNIGEPRVARERKRERKREITA